MSVKIAVIIPTRGDRPKFLQFAIDQMSKQTLKPDKIFVMDYPPTCGEVDLTQRIKKGYELAKGYDLVFIIEDDDYYPCDYIQKMSNIFVESKADIIGIEQTLYYNIFDNRYMEISHPGRSSLFCTAMRGGLNIKWPNDSERFLDIFLFRHIKNKYLVKTLENNPVGIKHGIGKTGGNAHRKGLLPKQDKDQNKLRKLVNNEAFKFYNSL